MSYDLMVFNPEVVPKSESEFLKWFHKQTEWNEDDLYNDLGVTSIGLRNWFIEIIDEFPAMNGPHSPDDIDDRIDDEEITEYSIKENIIYCCFRWPIAKKAYSTTIELAEKHGIGFYNPSGDGKIYMSDKYGNYREIKAHSKKIFSYGGISNYKELIAPNWEDIYKVVAKVDGKNISFLILENEKGNYIQCLGDSESVTIEYRYNKEKVYEHVVLGKIPISKTEITIKTSTGEVDIYENETFNSEELIKVIRGFYESNKVDNELNFRKR